MTHMVANVERSARNEVEKRVTTTRTPTPAASNTSGRPAAIYGCGTSLYK